MCPVKSKSVTAHKAGDMTDSLLNESVASGSADQEREVADVLQGHSGTFCYGQQRILGNMELNADLVGKTLVETAEQSAATGKINAVLDDVGIKFGWSLLQSWRWTSLYSAIFPDMIPALPSEGLSSHSGRGQYSRPADCRGR